MTTATAGSVVGAQAPGWKTSEFWLTVTGQALVAGLAYVQLHLADLGANPIVTAIAAPILGLVVGWLNKTYGDNRTQLKAQALATQAAASASATPQVAQAILNQ